MTSLNGINGINGRSIQTLLRGENDSKQSDEFQARGHVQSSVFWNKNNIMELTLEVNCFGFIIMEYLQNYLKN